MEEGRRRKKWKRFCYDSVLFHRVKQGNQTQVMNEVDTGASGSSCGGGGGGVGGGGVTRKSGGIRETGRRRDSSEDGLPFSFLSVCQGICRAFKRKSKPKNQVFSLFPSVAIYPSGLSHQFQSFADISRGDVFLLLNSGEIKGPELVVR